jgi:GGDEF domain-containing protein
MGAFIDLDHFKSLNTKLTDPVVDREVASKVMRVVDNNMVGRGLRLSAGWRRVCSDSSQL